MGWFDRLFGSRSKKGATPDQDSPPSGPEQVVPQRPAARPPQFVVIDVETTGLSPKLHRVLELAVVRIDASGQVVDEWSTRFNPEGPVGATHIHGITQADVADSPPFHDVAASVVPYIAGLPIAAHNARFDLAFLRAEFRRAGWDVPWLPAYCTLDGSRHYMPNLDRRRLVDCCWGASVPLNDAHSALGDARATAGLLRHYLHSHGRVPPHATLLSVQNDAPSVVWPSGPSRAPGEPLPDEQVATRPRPIRVSEATRKQPALIAQLARLSLIDVLDEGAPAGSLTYVETLLDALEDGIISKDEATALQDLVQVYELGEADVAATHHALVLALAHRALDDGHVSRSERGELESVASSLRLADEIVPQLIAEADTARRARLAAGLGPLPTEWALGDPLRVGDKVVFTGFEGREGERARLEQRTQELGVRVLGNVSGRTAMLVTDGSFSGGKLARAREQGTRIVDPETYATLLAHLQPAEIAVPTPRHASPSTASPVAGTSPEAVGTTAAPGEIRAWAIQNGYTVGVRGRLPAELVRAYEIALLDARKATVAED